MIDTSFSIDVMQEKVSIDFVLALAKSYFSYSSMTIMIYCTLSGLEKKSYIKMVVWFNLIKLSRNNPLKTKESGILMDAGLF